MPNHHTERSAKRDAALRDAGLTQRKCWAYPADWPAIKRYIDRKNANREKAK